MLYYNWISVECWAILFTKLSIANVSLRLSVVLFAVRNFPSINFYFINTISLITFVIINVTQHENNFVNLFI